MIGAAVNRRFACCLQGLLLALLCNGFAQEPQRKKGPPELPKPDLADLKYGPHERNVLDLWKAKTSKPAPLVLYIHGGGFRAGDKKSLNASLLKSYLETGFAVAAINYRFTSTAPAPAAYMDCARALQLLRQRAKEWNIDPHRVASTGGSAGAGTSMWLAFHDDLADPKSADPVGRQSTRLTCIAVDNGQSSYSPLFAEKIGIPRPNFERHEFFIPFYGLSPGEFDSPRAVKLYEEMAAITYLSRDDPPALLEYSYPNEEVRENSPLGLIVHHPKFGTALKQRMDGLGIECIVQYLDRQGGQLVRYPENLGQKPVAKLDFLKQHLKP